MTRVVILAGGRGTRLAEETELRPKPMVEIGGQPILWHILKHYAHFGFIEFYIALGYRGEVIKRYFLDYHSMNGDLTVHLKTGELSHHDGGREDWTVHLIETGLDTHTGGRLKRLERHLSDSTFMVTYGDGVSDVNLAELLSFHKRHGRLATITAVRPPARFGGVVFDGDRIAEFTEKPQAGEGWINGGYLVFEPGIFEYLKGDFASLEAQAMERLARNGQLAAYRHEGFWQCMDTLRDLRLLQTLWQGGAPPWKLWA
jgi:glucose-1-phosphate cytidylyltransferase